MTPEDYQLATDLFHEVFDLAPAERVRILDERAPTPEIRAEVEFLLGSTTRDGFADENLGAANRVLLDAAEDAAQRPHDIGPYRVIRRIGAGGMGVVYLAEQQSPRRQVALKLQRAGDLDSVDTRRFEREAELLGRLQHPGIAQIFESGTTTPDDDGTTAIYIAMEHVDGVAITEFVRRENLDLAARVRLIIELVQAVHHAHLRGVLHRDLKPSNVLVTTNGQVKVIDFGIARPLEPDDDSTLETMTGQVVGTLAYMSPEQVRGDVARIDARTDVYALGTLAYQLLGGRPPHDFGNRPIPEVVRLINDIDPAPLGTVDAACRGDLELIVAKAMAKEPERRYQSAAALADDFERHVNFEPIEARPTSVTYQFRRFARRHRALVTAGVVAIAAVLIGAGVAVRFAIRNADLAASEIAARELADDNAKTAKRLQLEAEQRVAEMTRIAAYQDSLVSDVDIAELGRQMADDLRASLRLALSRSGLAEDAAAMTAASFDRGLDVLNPSEVARRSLERIVFDRSFEAIEERFETNSTLQLRLFESLASTMFDLGFVRPARDVYARAVDGLADGNATPETALGVRQGLAIVLRRLRDFDGAEALQRTCLADAEALFGHGSVRHRRALLELAATIGYRNDLATSEALMRQALELAEEQDEVSIHALSLLATNLQATGRGAEALAMRRRAYEGHCKIGRAVSLNALVTRTAIGEDLLALGRIDDARDELRQALTDLRREVGDEHVETVACVELLARTYLLENRLDEAAPLVRETLAAYRRIHGDDHGKTFDNLTNLSRLETLLGDFAAARPLAEEAYARARAMDHPRVTDFAAVLRDVYVGLDKAGEPNLASKIDELEAFIRDRR